MGMYTTLYKNSCLFILIFPFSGMLLQYLKEKKFPKCSALRSYLLVDTHACTEGKAVTVKRSKGTYDWMQALYVELLDSD